MSVADPNDSGTVVAPWAQYLQRTRRAEPRALNLPSGFEDVELAGIEERGVQTVVTHYLRHFYDLAPRGHGVLFAGRSGTYKTYGVCVIAKRVWETLALPVDFFDCASEFPKIDRGWYEGYAAQRIRYASTAALTVIDDFNQARDTQRDLAVFAEILNARYAARLPTLFTANIMLTQDARADLDARFGFAPVRRLLERTEKYRVFIK